MLAAEPQMLYGQRPGILGLAQREAHHKHVLIERPHHAARPAARLGHIQVDSAIDAGEIALLNFTLPVSCCASAEIVALPAKWLLANCAPATRHRGADRAVR